MGDQPRKKRNGLTIRAYLGTCLLCRHGVFDGDDITRGRGQQLGLMHTACVRPAVAPAAGMKPAPVRDSTSGSAETLSSGFGTTKTNTTHEEN